MEYDLRLYAWGLCNIFKSYNLRLVPRFLLDVPLSVLFSAIERSSREKTGNRGGIVEYKNLFSLLDSFICSVF
jgi:hypothetical protein